jgi:hypothetical protein
MYWNDLPCNVASAIVRDNLNVWPVITSSSSKNPTYSGLASLIVTSDAENQETLTALALAGVSMTQPPTYIKDLLLEAGAGFSLLTPDTAREALLVSYYPVSRCQAS